MPLDLTNNSPYLIRIQIFERTHNVKKTLHIFTINKLKFTQNNTGNLKLEDVLIEHKSEYDKKSFDELLNSLSKDPKEKIRFVEEVKCIFGFVKFYFGFYAILVTHLSKIGKIGDFIINRVEKLKILPLFSVNNSNIHLDLENKYLTIFKNFDPTKQLYFSFTYDITKTLQRNFVQNFKKESSYESRPKDDQHDEQNKNRDSKNDSTQYNFNLNLQNNEGNLDLKKVTNNTFLWNHYHIKEFYTAIINKIWITFFIYGFFEQVECLNYGLRFLLTIIARRNRKYAGTRYLKRGINDDGNVANDVETEQILEEISTSCAEMPVISSYIHIRGSVPIYWYQEQSGILPKPDIKVNYTDTFYEATKKHFYILTQRYGKPILVCNLTKKKEGSHKQEELLNNCFSEGLEYLNSFLENKKDEKIIYYHYDLKNERRDTKFYTNFYEISYGLIEKTKMFSFIPHLRSQGSYFLELQSGVIRSNCVDCLDRTNVFQQVIGTAVMVNQLRLMGVNINEPNHEEGMFGTLTEVYKNMGNVLSSQYAGSLAHKQTIKDNRNFVKKIVGFIPEIFNTCKRYFNNSFNDHYKQASINLFLGKYKIKFLSNQQHLWELLTDIMLHRKNKNKNLSEDWLTQAFYYYNKYNLIDDIFEITNKNLINNFKKHNDEKANKDKESDTPTDIYIDGDRESIIKLESNFNNLPITENKNLSLLDFIYLNELKLNTYHVNLQKIKIYKKIINYVKIINEERSFINLDIDKKTHIKNFYSFNYNINYDNSPSNNSYIDFRNVTLNETLSNKSLISFTQHVRDSSQTKNMIQKRTAIVNSFDPKIQFNTPITINSKSKTFNSEEEIRNSINSSLSYFHLTNQNELQTDWELKEPQSMCEFQDHLQHAVKPQFEMKIASFDMDDKEISLVNEFIHPSNSYNLLSNDEYRKVDGFLNVQINNDNYSKIFDPNLFEDEYEFTTPELNKNEFVEEFLNKIHKFGSNKNQKISNKYRNKDYLIYNVDEQQFYRKLNRDINESIDSSSGIICSNSNKSQRNDSPKVKVNVNKIPFVILEDHL